MARLFLFDGTALAYRSHYALSQSNLSTADGKPTGATYGFTMALRRILEQEKPDLVAVALDAPGKTFRHERFEEYKATREKAPEEMLAQLDWIRDVIRAHGVPIFEVEGYEADDVIGTLATQAERAGHEVMIVTADKDMMQLVSDKVRLYNIFKRNEQDVVIQGPEAVEEKFGTDPEHVVDVLAIMGDSSDNVPGVKGIGEKGAIKLIGEYGSVGGLLEHLDQVKGKAREKIENDREKLLLSLELVKIDREVPLEPGLDSIGPPEPDNGKLIDLFRNLEFLSLVDKVAMSSESTFSKQAKTDYKTVETREELDQMLADLRAEESFVVDTETTSLFPMEAELVGVSFGCSGGRAWYVPFNLAPPLMEGGRQALLDALTPILMEWSFERAGQNTKYDWIVFARHGLHVPPPQFDTMVASFTVAGSQRRHGLDNLALHYFGLKKIPTKELLGTGKKQITMDQVPIDQIAEYACEDAEVTWRLKEKLEQELEENGALGLFYDLEMPLVPVLGKMEERGIRLDVELLARHAAEMDTELTELTHRIQEHARENFNVNSTKVLGEVLFEKLRIQDEAGVKKPRRTKTGWATDAETLSTRYGDVPIVKALLEYREIAKLKSTYVDGLPRYVNAETGRIHCSFSQVSAATGRLASSDPNLQNIPVRSERGRKLREAFVPREPDEDGEWVLLAADYSQIELRVMAHLSGDEHMRQTFHEDRDVHAATAMRIFGVLPDKITREMRSQAKVINFGLLYGMGPQRLARETGLSLNEAKHFIELYFRSFPTVKDWMTSLLEDAKEKGYVETLLGRRRRLPEIHSSNSRMRSNAENAAINTPVQGSAADIIKRAMIDLEDKLEHSQLKGRMLLQVHDELVLEVPRSQLDDTIAVTREAMEEAIELEVPLKVDFGWGANWLEAH